MDVQNLLFIKLKIDPITIGSKDDFVMMDDLKSIILESKIMMIFEKILNDLCL